MNHSTKSSCITHTELPPNVLRPVSDVHARVCQLFAFTFDLLPHFMYEMTVTVAVSISQLPKYRGHANRLTISYPTNNTLVVPPNYTELFMSIRAINRV